MRKLTPEELEFVYAKGAEIAERLGDKDGPALCVIAVVLDDAVDVFGNCGYGQMADVFEEALNKAEKAEASLN